ncbi:hypothetical protein WICPIJ_008916 [Wickerhamomyces pijperi]|uniref:Uncharacterized protein n=1 Tax=Wickerhamomyces pijperi TaxID=599730 RepID=A0A9P8TGN7_WICPI|nr:hypothetical protein WICPIJ_008916 [Wickerhamomyces pijperi]
MSDVNKTPQKPTSYSSLNPGQLLLIKSPYYPNEKHQLLAFAVHTNDVTQAELKIKLDYVNDRSGPVPVFIFGNDEFKWVKLEDIYGIITKEFALNERAILQKLRDAVLQLQPYQSHQLISLNRYYELSKIAHGKGISFYENWLRVSGHLGDDEEFEQPKDFGLWIEPLVKCHGVDLDDDEYDLLQMKQDREQRLLESGPSKATDRPTSTSPAKTTNKITTISTSSSKSSTPGKDSPLQQHKSLLPNNPPPNFLSLKPGMLLVVKLDISFPRVCTVLHASQMSDELLQKKMSSGTAIAAVPVLFFDTKEYTWINLDCILEWQVTISTVKKLNETAISRKASALTEAFGILLTLLEEARAQHKSPLEVFLRKEGLLQKNTPYVQYENCGLWSEALIARKFNINQRKSQWIDLEQKRELDLLGTTIEEVKSTQLNPEVKATLAPPPVTSRKVNLHYVDLSEDDDEDEDDQDDDDDDEDDQDENYDITKETRGAKSTKISETSRSTSPSVALNPAVLQAPLRTYQRPFRKLKPGTLTLIDPLTPAITLHPLHLTTSQLKAKRDSNKILCVPLLKLTEDRAVVWRNPSDLELITRKDVENFHQVDKDIPVWNQMMKLYSRAQRAGWSLMQQVLREENLLRDDVPFSEPRELEGWLKELTQRETGPQITKREMKWLTMRQKLETRILNAEEVTVEEIEEVENYNWRNDPPSESDNEDTTGNESKVSSTLEQHSKSATPGAVDKRFPHRKAFARYTDVVPGTLVVTKYFGKRPTPCFVVNCEEHLTHDALRVKMKKKTSGPIPVLFLDDLTYTWAWLKDIMLLTKEECYESYDPNSGPRDLMKGYEEAQSLFETSEKTGQDIFEVFLRRVDLLEDDEEYMEYDDFGEWLNALKKCEWFNPTPKALSELKKKQRQDVMLLDELDDYTDEDDDEEEEAQEREEKGQKSIPVADSNKRKESSSNVDRESTKKQRTIQDFYHSGRPQSERAEQFKEKSSGIDNFFDDIRENGSKSKTAGYKKVEAPSEELIESNIRKARSDLYFSMLDETRDGPVPLSQYGSTLSSLYKLYQYDSNKFLTIEHIWSSKIHLILKAVREVVLDRGTVGADVLQAVEELRGLSWLLLSRWSKKGWLSELKDRALKAQADFN